MLSVKPHPNQATFPPVFTTSSLRNNLHKNIILLVLSRVDIKFFLVIRCKITTVGVIIAHILNIYAS